MTTDQHAQIAEKLETYRLARGISLGSRDRCQLLASYQRKPQFLAQLLDRELARIDKRRFNPNDESN